MNKKSPLNAFLSLLLLSVLLVNLCSAVSADAELSWNVQVVDLNGARAGYGRVCPIVVDSNDNPHILYIAPYNNCNVTYASLNGSAWSTQVIAGGLAFSLVIDVKDTPHVLRSGLTYASWTGSNWTSQIVDPTVTNGFAALTLDSFGNPHIAYVNDNGTMVKYASWTGSKWDIQTVDTYGPAGIPYPVSLTLDSNDTPYILYISQNLKIAVFSNSSWDIQTVASNVTMFGNMVLDSKDYPHLIYQIGVGRNSTIVYASWDGVSWNRETVVSNADLVNVGFLALDSNDHPHISYVASAYHPEIGDVNSLEYARWTDAAWNIQTVDKKNYTAFGPCYLALDSNDNPHISFTGAPPPPSDIYYRSAYVMYATASEPTQTALPLLLALTAVIIGAIIIITVYFKKRKR